MNRRGFLRGVLAAAASRALPAPRVAGLLAGDVAPVPAAAPAQWRQWASMAMGGATLMYVAYGLMKRDVQ
jgi:hypothetical protein